MVGERGVGGSLGMLHQSEPLSVGYEAPMQCAVCLCFFIFLPTNIAGIVRVSWARADSTMGRQDHPSHLKFPSAIHALFLAANVAPRWVWSSQPFSRPS
jgi:hypothetical protein